MIHIRINQQKKLFLFDTDECISGSYDSIKKIGPHYYCVNSKPNSTESQKYIFNSNSKKIEKEIEFAPNYQNGENVVLSEKGKYLVLSSLSLKLLFEAEKIKDDPYNFFYLGDKYYISAKTLFYDNEQNIGLLNEESLITKYNNHHIYSINEKIIYQFGSNYLFLDNLDHEIESIFNQFGFLIIYSKNTSSIYVKGKRVFKGLIENNNFKYGGIQTVYFTSNSKTYFLTPLSSTIFSIDTDLNQNNFLFEVIYQSGKKIAVLYDNRVLIFDGNSNKAAVHELQPPLNLKITNKDNKAKMVLFMKDECIYELGGDDSSKYFFDSSTNTIKKCNRQTILPEIIGKHLYFLDLNGNDNLIELDAENIQFIDYCYFKDSFSYITEQGGNFKVANNKDLFVSKLFKKKISFEKSKSIIINTDPGTLKSFDFYTIFDNDNTLIKPKFKCYGLVEKVGLYNSRIDLLFSGQNDWHQKQIELTDEFAFATQRD